MMQVKITYLACVGGIETDFRVARAFPCTRSGTTRQAEALTRQNNK